MSDYISRQDAIDAFWKLEAELRPSAIDVVLDMLKYLPSAQPELIEQAAYVRGFEQGRTQGMIDAQGEKMNRQRKVVITVTYNDLGTIVDTEAEELDLSAQPETCEDIYSICGECDAWNKYRNYKSCEAESKKDNGQEG